MTISQEDLYEKKLILLSSDSLPAANQTHDLKHEFDAILDQSQRYQRLSLKF